MRERLAAYLGDVFWTDLRAHAARDALIVVAEDLDMLDAGVAIASNDTKTVAAWIDERRLSKPSTDDLARWPSEPLATFESLVVAPYVLIRPRRGRAVPPSN
jgi:hypothetical protein